MLAHTRLRPVCHTVGVFLDLPAPLDSLDSSSHAVSLKLAHTHMMAKRLVLKTQCVFEHTGRTSTMLAYVSSHPACPKVGVFLDLPAPQDSLDLYLHTRCLTSLRRTTLLSATPKALFTMTSLDHTMSRREARKKHK